MQTGENLQKIFEPPPRLGEHDLPDFPVPGLEYHYDAVPGRLELRYRYRRATFFVVYRPDWTERSLKSARNEIVHSAQSPGMVVLPYLNQRQLQTLAQEGLSGMDLCGNTCITTPDDWLIWVSGRPNRFSLDQALKNPYSGKASLVGRTLMRQSVFRKLEDLAAEIGRRGGELSLALVSRAVKRLRDDVIVDSHTSGKVYLLQPDALLDRLAQAWERNTTKTRAIWRGRAPRPTNDFLPEVFQNASLAGIRAIMTGLGSASHHTNVSMEDTAYLYADAAEPLLRGLNAQPTERFPNLEIRRAPDDAVYFDADDTDPRGIRWASPVQTYLEKQSDDIRMRDSAQPLRQRLINNALSFREVAL